MRSKESQPNPAESGMEAPSPLMLPAGKREASASRRWSTTKLLLKWTLFGVTAYFVGRALVRQYVAIDWGSIHFYILPVVASVLLLTVERAAIAVNFRTLLALFNLSLTWRAMLPAAWLPPMGKYLPGKVASMAGVIWFLEKQKVPGHVAVMTTLLLTSLRILTGLLLAAPLTLWEPVRQRLPYAWLWCSVLLVAGTLSLHPRILGPLMGWLGRRLKHIEPPVVCHLKDYFGTVLIMFAQWAIIGVATWMLARSMGSVPASQIPLFIAGSALAINIGFLAIFAPGGLGVREGILLVFLEQTNVTPAHAAILVVLLRFVFTVIEVGLALAGLVIFRQQEKRAGAEPAGALQDRSAALPKGATD